MRLLLALLLLMAAPAWGAIATIPVEGGGATTTGTSAGIAATTFNVAAGDIVIVVARFGSATDTSTTTALTAACSSEALTKAGGGSNGTNGLAVFYKINSGGGTACGGAINFSGSTTARVNTYLIRGALTTAAAFDPNPLSNSNFASFATTTSLTTATFTQAFTDELIVCIVGTDGSPATIAPGGSEVEAFAEYNNRLQVETISSATTGSKTCSWTFATTTAGNTFMFGVKSSTSSAVSAPSLSAVSLNACTATTCTVNYTNSDAVSTAHVVGCKKDQAPPSVAEALADDCTGGATPLCSASEATTGSADTIACGSLGTFPVLDLYMAATNSGGNSSLSTLADNCMGNASGKQIINCPTGLTSIASGSLVADLNALIATDVATGDIPTCDTLTTPSVFPVVAAVDGNVSYGPPADSSRQYVNCTYYDVSALGNNADDLDAWFNDPGVSCSGDNLTQAFKVGELITPLNLLDFGTCASPLGDTLTATSTTLSTGLTLDSDGTLHGTPTVEAEAGNAVTVTATSAVTGATGTFDFTIFPRDTITVPTCIGEIAGDYQSALENIGVSSQITVVQQSLTVPAGYIISCSPAAAQEIDPFTDEVEITMSLGRAAGSGRKTGYGFGYGVR